MAKIGCKCKYNNGGTVCNRAATQQASPRTHSWGSLFQVSQVHLPCRMMTADSMYAAVLAVQHLHHHHQEEEVCGASMARPHAPSCPPTHLPYVKELAAGRSVVGGVESGEGAAWVDNSLLNDADEVAGGEGGRETTGRAVDRSPAIP